MRTVLLMAVVLTAASGVQGAEPVHQTRVAEVAKTPGLVAFWDFALMQDGRWTSYHDDRVVDRGFPVSLRRIGDPNSYTPGIGLTRTRPRNWSSTPRDRSVAPCGSIKATSLPRWLEASSTDRRWTSTAGSRLR
jgi:hypothetical protein